MLLCLYRHPQVTPRKARLGVVSGTDVVDVHLVCASAMGRHMKVHRAQEIAAALAPSELLGFLEGGPHSWNALIDSLERLGPSLDHDLLGPCGERVVVPKREARLVPVVPPVAGWSSRGLGKWDSTPVPSPGSDTVVALHTDGQAYLPEYLAVIGATAAAVAPDHALDHVAAVAVVRPSRPESACLLHRLPATVEDEDHLERIVATAVVAASRDRTLYAGDVVRCGPPLVVRTVDLRGSAPIDLAGPADVRPST